jgi:hypothetical protein
VLWGIVHCKDCLLSPLFCLPFFGFFYLAPLVLDNTVVESILEKNPTEKTSISALIVRSRIFPLCAKKRKGHSICSFRFEHIFDQRLRIQHKPSFSVSRDSLFFPFYFYFLPLDSSP